MKEYLGDRVYAEFEFQTRSRGLKLTTEDGIRATNMIFLEPEVIVALEDYLKRLRAALAAEREGR